MEVRKQGQDPYGRRGRPRVVLPPCDQAGSLRERSWARPTATRLERIVGRAAKRDSFGRLIVDLRGRRLCGKKVSLRSRGFTVPTALAEVVADELVAFNYPGKKILTDALAPGRLTAHTRITGCRPAMNNAMQISRTPGHRR